LRAGETGRRPQKERGDGFGRMGANAAPRIRFTEWRTTTGGKANSREQSVQQSARARQRKDGKVLSSDLKDIGVKENKKKMARDARLDRRGGKKKVGTRRRAKKKRTKGYAKFKPWGFGTKAETVRARENLRGIRF